MTIDQLPDLPDANGTVYFPVNKDGADYKMPTGGVSFLTFRAASSPTTLSVSNNARFAIISSASAANDRGFWIFNSTSTGSISNTAVLDASNVTFTAATNSLDVSNSARTAFFVCIVFNGSVTLA